MNFASTRNSNKNKITLPPSLFDFDSKTHIEYSGSNFESVMGESCDNILKVAKSDIKYLDIIKYGVFAIQQFVTSITPFFKSSKPKEFNYTNVNAFFNERYIHKIPQKHGAPPKEKIFGKVFNPFYFIIIYLILRNKKKECEEKETVCPDYVLNLNVNAIDEGNNLNFNIKSSGADSQQSSQFQFGSPGGQSSDEFITNAWKIMTCFLDLLYGKYDVDKPHTSIKMSPIIKYMYPFYLEVAQMTQSLYDIGLLPDCAFNITVLQYKEFMTKVFQLCPSSSEGSRPGMMGPSMYGPWPQGGGFIERTDAKKRYGCDFYGSTSTITKMLNAKQNRVCTIIKNTLKELKELKEDYKLLTTGKTVNYTQLVNRFADDVIYNTSGEPTSQLSNNSKQDYNCDFSKFYAKMFKLYLTMARSILQKLSSSLSSVVSSMNKKDTNKQQFDNFKKDIDRTLQNIAKLSV